MQRDYFDHGELQFLRTNTAANSNSAPPSCARIADRRCTVEVDEIRFPPGYRLSNSVSSGWMRVRVAHSALDFAWWKLVESSKQHWKNIPRYQALLIPKR